jgi:hypothetical protein
MSWFSGKGISLRTPEELIDRAHENQRRNTQSQISK